MKREEGILVKNKKWSPENGLEIVCGWNTEWWQSPVTDVTNKVTFIPNAKGLWQLGKEFIWSFIGDWHNCHLPNDCQGQGLKKERGSGGTSNNSNKNSRVFS